MFCRFLTLILVLPFFVASAVSGQQGEGPKAPEPIKAAPVQVFKDAGRLGLMLSENGKVLHTVDDGILRTWELASGKEIERIEDPLFNRAISPSPDGKFWVMRYMYPDVPSEVIEFRVIDPQTRKVIRILERIRGNFGRVNFSKDGKKFLALDYIKNNVAVWDLASGKRLPELVFEGVDTRIEWLDRTPDGRAFVIRPEGSVRMVDAQSGKEIWRLKGPRSELAPGPYLAFSPDCQWVVTSNSFENELDLYDARSGRLVRRITWAEDDNTDPETKRPRLTPNLDRLGGNWAVTFSSDGRVILVSGRDRRLTIVEVATGMIRWRLDTDVESHLLWSCSRGFGILTPGNIKAQSIKVWDRLNPTGNREKVPAAQLRKLIAKLALSDAAEAAVAMQLLVANAEETVSVLSETLQVVPPVENATLKTLLRDLTSDDAGVRTQAEQQLRVLGPIARSALLAEAKRNPPADLRLRIDQLLEHLDDPANSDCLLALRAIEVLEYIASDAARMVLRRLSAGASGAYLTEEARAALGRLER